MSSRVDISEKSESLSFCKSHGDGLLSDTMDCLGSTGVIGSQTAGLE